MERFNPSNEKAKAEKKDKKDHFANLYDMNEDMAGQKIDEATGKNINNTPEVSGADEKLGMRFVDKDDPSSDIMGSVPDALPDDPAKLEEWVKKETARIQKQKEQRKKAA